MKLPWPLSRRLVFSVAGIALLMVMVDFPLRVLVLRDASVRAFSVPTPPVMAIPPNEKRIEQALETWFPKLPEVTETTVVERGMSLRAVFGSAAGARAIIRLDPAGDLPAQFVTVKNGENIVDGWVVERVRGQQVVLKRNGETREMALFQRPEK